MACELSTIQEGACDSGIGRLTNEIALLQVIAQNLAGWLSSIDSGAEVTVDAILERACLSGIGMVQDEIKLLQIAASNLCELIT